MRVMHNSVIAEDKLFIFFGKNRFLLNSVIFWQFQQHKWEEVIIKGDKIGMRIGCTIEYVDTVRAFYIFGGSDQNGFSSNELFKIELDSFECKQLSKSIINKEDYGVHFHSMIFDGKENLFVFGGKNEKGMKNDLLKYNIPKDTWESIPKQKNTPPNTSLYHCFPTEKNLIVIDQSNFENIFSFDLATLRWRKYKSKIIHNNQSLLDKKHYTFTFDKINKCIYLLGGYSDKNESFSSWILNYEIKTNEKNEDSLFLKFPNILLEYIISFLPFSDILATSNTCKKMNKVCKRDSIWSKPLQHLLTKTKELNIKEPLILKKIEKQSNYECCLYVLREFPFLISYFFKLNHFGAKFETFLGSWKEIEDQMVRRFPRQIDLKTDSSLTFVKVVTLGGEQANYDYWSNMAFSYILMYDQNYPIIYFPTCLDNPSENIILDKKTFNVSFAYTGGHDDYDRIRPLIYKGSNIFLVLFSIHKRKTFERMQNKWVQDIRNPLMAKKFDYSKDTPLIILGLSADEQEERVVSYEEASNYAKKVNGRC
eukprot:TRINITY_DN10320_c0_g1_i1.p1 TRINITY_DN10320_c0_g1~~TRINITY_DN10320_c0_g1_i1.p1  ORF type:complete len:621 (+),score=136.12 TRINITY_DN10320_c0_g1_i1:253-1863(+)